MSMKSISFPILHVLILYIGNHLHETFKVYTISEFTRKSIPNVIRDTFVNFFNDTIVMYPEEFVRNIILVNNNDLISN